MKVCTHCKLEKEDHRFRRRPHGKLTSWCKDCTNAGSRDYFKRTMYGITGSEYAQMVEEQGGRCLICLGQPDRSLHTDHCHGTGAVRGLLCSRCNIGLGCFKEDPELLSRAVMYLIGGTLQLGLPRGEVKTSERSREE